MLLYDTFGATVRGSPDRIALVCDGKRYRYADIERSVRALAACLQSRGVARGDRVAVFLDNSVEAVVSLYAILRVGAVFMPINPLTRKEKLAFLLDDARASALVTHALLQETWAGALSHGRTVHTCIVAGADSPTAQVDRCMSFEHALAMPGEPREVALVDQDLAALIYTSGSTGEPKGVMLTHLNMLSAARSIVGYLGLRDTDVILCALPLAFDYGLYQVLMGFMVGATIVLERSFAFPVKILETMVRERVTVLPGVPTMFSMLLNIEGIARYDLTALRMLTNTAAALPETRISELRHAFPQARLYSMYGVTECKRVSYLPPEELDVRPTSVGRGMPNQEHWLVDDEGRRLPNGSQGELVVRGSHVMRGYWERPEDTARALRPGPLPGELVLYTGDIFRTDTEGYLYFVARKDDIIKSRGEKVSPREVENALYGLDGVIEAAVLGVPDPVLGSAIKAVVALKPGYRYSEREVIRHCQAMLESFMAPKYVEFVEALPKTNNGKIDKKELA